MFYALVRGEKDPWYGDKSQSTLWEEKKPAANRIHPTAKPVELVERALRNSRLVIWSRTCSYPSDGFRSTVLQQSDETIRKERLILVDGLQAFARESQQTMKTCLVLIRNGIRRRYEAAARCVIIAAVFALCFASAGTAQIQPSPILTDQLLAQAAPDECFAGIGQPYPAMLSPGVCPSGSVPKTNQAYVWGLTQSGTKLWFGTAANVTCITPGSVQNPTPIQTTTLVCEYGESQYGQAHDLPPDYGDWRPPKAYVYDTATSTLTDKTPIDSKFSNTLGMRSAGTMGDTVFIAGPALGKKGVNIFAWSSSTQHYLGSCQVSSFNNIRQWRLINNVLYAGVGNETGGGSIIRWNGTPQQPFDTSSSTCGFEIVANLPGEAAYLTAFGDNSDQIAVSAWPNPHGAGVYLSPVMNAARGLTARDASAWTRVWEPSNYEPDPVTATAYAGGAIAYWNGALYFGTMNLVTGGLLAFEKVYGTPPQQQFIEVFQNTYRAISIWAIQSPSTTPTVQLLYGESALPKYDPTTATFVSTPTGFTPLYSPSGFGNLFNGHTWSATVFQNRLFFGTMDWSYLQGEGRAPPPAPGVIQPSSAWGADLWRFDSAPGPAVAENLNGLGDFLNIGFRNLTVSPDGQSLFLGTASTGNLTPMAGWQLWDLQLAP